MKRITHRLTRVVEGGTSSVVSNAYQKHLLWSQQRHLKHHSSLRMSRKALKVVGGSPQHFSLHHPFPYEHSAYASSLLARSLEDTDHLRSEYQDHSSWFDCVSLFIALYPHVHPKPYHDNVGIRSPQIRTKSFSSPDRLGLCVFAFTYFHLRDIVRERRLEPELGMV